MIFFEEIKPAHRWLIRWYLWRGKKVCFLRADKACYGQQWFKDCLSAGLQEEDSIVFQAGSFDGYYYDAAFDHAEQFFHCFSEDRAVSSVRTLYGNAQTDLAFKKVLTHRLARFYYLRFLIGEVQKKYAGEESVFIPANGIELYRTDGCDVCDYDYFLRKAMKWEGAPAEIPRVKILFFSRAVSYACVFKRQMILIAKVAALPVWVLFKSAVNLRRPGREKRDYPYAITIVSPRQLMNEIQKVDFLVNDNQIKKDEVIFISSKGIPQNGQEYFEKNGFDFVKDVAGFVSLKEGKEILNAYWRLWRSALCGPSFVTEVALKGLYFYTIWKSLSRHVGIKKLVTYCDYEIKALFRNIIFEQTGCATYLYMDSSNFGCFTAKRETQYEFRHHFLGFLYYDWFISWNDRTTEYFQKSFCVFKNVANLGCFWSEHVRLIREKKLPVSDLKESLRQNGYQEGAPLISVFDSTFHDLSMTTYGDGINFLKGICALIEDLPGAFFIFKEKNPRGYHQTISRHHEEINALYEKLESHPRCYFTGRKENSSKIIAISDVVISFPFTSTTLEALAARERAVWYDASDKFRGAYYDDIPGLICHGYEELRERVERLCAASTDDYNEYLDAHVKGKVEPYLDGYAITRFRDFLSGASEVGVRAPEGTIPSDAVRP